MSSANLSNAPEPDATSTTAPEHLTEQEFLSLQARQAKAALANTLTELQRSVIQGVDPRAWTREHPMAAVGSALGAGFVAALLAVPSRRQQAAWTWEKLRAAMSPPPEPHASESKNGHDKPSVSGHSLLNLILREVIPLLGPILGSFISAVHAPPHQPQASTDPQPVGKG